MFHAAFDNSDTEASIYTGTLSESRLQATVLFARVFARLGISFLTTLSGILLLFMALNDGPGAEGSKEVRDALEFVRRNGIF